MLPEHHALTRSKSEEQLIKTNILSPTPIRNYFPNVLNGISSGPIEHFFGNAPENFIVRKHQSFGTLNLEEKWWVYISFF